MPHILRPASRLGIPFGLLLLSLLSSPAAPIVLDSLPLLFVDDTSLESTKGVTRVFHEAVTRREPVVVADQPWEKGRVYLYGNVVFDPKAGQFSMWYSTPKPSSVLYATSRDGLTWTKPSLGLPVESDTPENNIVFAHLHTPSVLLDENASNADERYKLMGKGPKGYAIAHSPDGIHWQEYQGAKSLPKGEDTLVLSRDPRTGEYLCYHKKLETIRGFERRLVYLSRSKDFRKWSESQLVFAPDEKDDAWATAKDQRSEVYNMSVFPHAGGFIGFPAMFRVELVRKRSGVSTNQSPDDGTIDIQLVTSPDGTHWSRTEPRANMIPRGALGTFDKGTILGLATQPVHHGDKTWIYYTAVSTSHGAPAPPKEISIGRAEWRLHGFASLDAQESGGVIETKPLRLIGSAISLNADATDGQIRLALEEADGSPISGYGLEDCDPMKGDSTSTVVKWRGSSQVPTDRQVRVKVKMDANSKIYSLSTVR